MYDITISIHAPRTGSDVIAIFIDRLANEFQSTLPARGATAAIWGIFQPFLFQSTLPARGATFRGGAHLTSWGISIHAPRTGSDGLNLVPLTVFTDFNPRSPHGERPSIPCQFEQHFLIFQSTLPARGATLELPQGVASYIVFQSTLPARGATNLERKCADGTQFQSTLPARGATRAIRNYIVCR